VHDITCYRNEADLDSEPNAFDGSQFGEGRKPTATSRRPRSEHHNAPATNRPCHAACATAYRLIGYDIDVARAAGAAPRRCPTSIRAVWRKRRTNPMQSAETNRSLQTTRVWCGPHRVANDEWPYEIRPRAECAVERARPGKPMDTAPAAPRRRRPATHRSPAANAPQRMGCAGTFPAIPDAVGACNFPQRMQRTQRMRWAIRGDELDASHQTSARISTKRTRASPVYAIAQCFPISLS
jgi:hypothetical protein